MSTLKRFFTHPVMGVYAAMLLAIIVATIGLHMTGHKEARFIVSQFGTFTVVIGFALYALCDYSKKE